MLNILKNDTVKYIFFAAVYRHIVGCADQSFAKDDH